MKLWLTCIIVAFCTTYCGATLLIQRNDMMTNQTTYCVDDNLLFTCTIPGSLYDWVVVPFLSGSVDNGRVALGVTETPGNFTLSANGTGNNRMSTLQVTAFSGLNGVNILCREVGGDAGVNQNVDVTVLGPPSSTVNASLRNRSLMLTLPITETLDVCLNSINATLFSPNDPVGRRKNGVILDGLSSTNAVITFDGLNICDYTYNYSVVGIGVVETVLAEADVMVSQTARVENQDVKPEENGVSITLDIVFEDCPNSTVKINRTDGQERNISVGIMQEVVFKNIDSSIYLYNCTVQVIVRGQEFDIDSFSCDSMTPTTTTESIDTTTVDGSLTAIIGGCVAAAVVLIILIIIVIVIVVMCCRPSRNRRDSQIKQSRAADGAEVNDSKGVEYDAVNHDKNRGGVSLQDQGATYMAHENIQRQAAATGDVYTVPANFKKKSSKKAKAEEELPMYSQVDKKKKKDESVVVYAALDVNNPVAARSKRPPPPPGVTEHDANEPVLYSTVH